MNDKEILQFLKAFEDFAKHSEEQIDSYQKREEVKHFSDNFYRKKVAQKFWEEVNYFAQKYEVTCDYILQEFYIDNK